MWLFDGLDELSPPLGERFYQALVNLPELKAVNCLPPCTRIFRREGDCYKELAYELLGLKIPIQPIFLTHVLNGDVRRTQVLHHCLQHN